MPATERQPAASDEVLASEARDGSLAAFTALLDRYDRRLLRFLMQRTRCISDAEDALQETCLKAWRNIHLYTPRWRFCTWLFTIAARVAIDMRRRNGAVRTQQLHDDEADHAATSAQAEAAPDNGLWTLARRLLPDEHYAALWLYYGEDMSVREISAVLGRSSAWVKVSLYRSRRALERAMSAEAEAGAAGPPPVGGGAAC